MAARSPFSALLAAALLAGCAPSSAPDSVKLPVTQASAIVSNETKTLTPPQLAQVTDQQADPSYRLGPNDIIAVSVYLHPELSMPVQTGSGINGALITGDGLVQLPLIGNVNVGGKTLTEAQQMITSAYNNYIVDPNVTVELVQAQSLRYYLLGAFTEPGVKYPVHSLTLLDALALGGSVDLSKADLYQAYVAQSKVKLPVDLHALLVDGDLSQNITLTPGDAIVIPSSAEESVYMMGAVSKPGAVNFDSGSLSLLQALEHVRLRPDELFAGAIVRHPYHPLPREQRAIYRNRCASDPEWQGAALRFVPRGHSFCAAKRGCDLEPGAEHGASVATGDFLGAQTHLWRSLICHGGIDGDGRVKIMTSMNTFGCV